MSTCELVREAWNSNVWRNDIIQALTSKIVDHELRFDSSNQSAAIRHGLEVNYFQYLVTWTQQILVMGQIRRNFEVLVRRVIKAEVNGDSYKRAITDLETVAGLVVSELGGSWSGTVDFYNQQNIPAQVRADTINGEPVWVAEMRFSAFKNI